MSSGFLLGAVLLHVVVFLMVATWVIFAPPAEVPDASFSPVSVKPPPPPPAAPAPSGGAAQNNLEPQPVVTPPSTPAALPHTEVPTDFNLQASNASLPSLPETLTDPSGVSLDKPGLTGLDAGAGNPFGQSTSNQQSLSGIFYDLKQSPNHIATKMDAKTEQAVLKDFFGNDWDEASLKKSYFSGNKPLFANEIMIPFQPSASGPTAFGLQKECKPGYWAIVYHVKVNPTRSGDFSLAGFGDDFLVARVNGVNVLDSGYYPPVTDFKRGKSYPPGPWLSAANTDGNKAYGRAVVGDKFHIDAGEDLNIDVLISDAVANAGGKGRCGYFLYLLEDKTYTTKDAQGNYVLPLLQIHPDPNVKRKGEYPPFTCRAEDALTGATTSQ